MYLPSIGIFRGINLLFSFQGRLWDEGIKREIFGPFELPSQVVRRWPGYVDCILYGVIILPSHHKDQIIRMRTVRSDSYMNLYIIRILSELFQVPRLWTRCVRNFWVKICLIDLYLPDLQGPLALHQAHLPILRQRWAGRGIRVDGVVVVLVHIYIAENYHVNGKLPPFSIGRLWLLLQKLTYSLKNAGWKTILSFWNGPFQGRYSFIFGHCRIAV